MYHDISQYVSFLNEATHRHILPYRMISLRKWVHTLTTATVLVGEGRREGEGEVGK
jgi:hypothetical protein